MRTHRLPVVSQVERLAGTVQLNKLRLASLSRKDPHGEDSRKGPSTGTRTRSLPGV